MTGGVSSWLAEDHTVDESICLPARSGTGDRLHGRYSQESNVMLSCFWKFIAHRSHSRPQIEMRRCLLFILIWNISTHASLPANIPSCARSANNSGIRGSGCAPTDISCTCSSENLKFAIESAIDVCHEHDQKRLRNFVEELCSNAVFGNPRCVRRRRRRRRGSPAHNSLRKKQPGNARNTTSSDNTHSRIKRSQPNNPLITASTASTPPTNQATTP
jgi:hypothetical protein